MRGFDLLRMSDKELMEQYEKELESVGAISLQSIILEFDRRKSNRIAMQMNRLTIVIAILTFLSVATTIIQLVK